jgi:hypothetical protein
VPMKRLLRPGVEHAPGFSSGTPQPRASLTRSGLSPG